MSALRPDEKTFVLVSKIYGVADPVLSLGIPTRLMEMGYQVVCFYDLPECDIFDEHPNMYWPFGQHILEPAYIIKAHPNMYAVLLTHHGCGPDTVLSHYFREIMDGKPYLNIEVDEHSSGVGVITRLEAFINSLTGIVTKTGRGSRNLSATNCARKDEYPHRSRCAQQRINAVSTAPFSVRGHFQGAVGP